MRELRALATLLKATELGRLTNATADQGITPQAASKTLAQSKRQLKHGVPPSVDVLAARQAGALAPVREAVGGTQRTPMLSTNYDQLELQIARSGRMAMQLISLLAMPYIEDGTLVPLPSPGLNATDLFLCRHSDAVLVAGRRLRGGRARPSGRQPGLCAFRGASGALARWSSGPCATGILHRNPCTG